VIDPALARGDEPQVDVLVVGGGIAGLWTLHALRAEGYDAWLCENRALGHGQSVQAQGIVHGGGKYALRKVSDLASVRAIRAMPDLWRAHHDGREAIPDLRAAEMVSPVCWLWLPKGSWSARWEAWGLVPLMRHAGVLACPPIPVPKDQWPGALRTSALRAYQMAEPVFDTRSVLRALAHPVSDRLLRVDRVEPIEGEDAAAHARVLLHAGDGRTCTLHARTVVLAAGAGNADLLGAAGFDAAMMQRRPLRMLLVRGSLPALHGHCIAGGRTRITVTSTDLGDGTRVWQVGGEVAERHADWPDGPEFHRVALAELRSCLPALDLARVQVSSYAAVRAEARTSAVRRPSGVQVQRLGPAWIVAWPTKWAMAPLLAEEVRREIASHFGASAQPPTLRFSDWPRPAVAAFPWEDVSWSPVPSATAA
jgi:glycerol-3-phosphate dehydrogenase